MHGETVKDEELCFVQVSTTSFLVNDCSQLPSIHLRHIQSPRLQVRHIPLKHMDKPLLPHAKSPPREGYHVFTLF